MRYALLFAVLVVILAVGVAAGDRKTATDVYNAVHGIIIGNG